jgi:DNA repair exonuclease SbcCD ATPase subunit
LEQLVDQRAGADSELSRLRSELARSVAALADCQSGSQRAVAAAEHQLATSKAEADKAIADLRHRLHAAESRVEVLRTESAEAAAVAREAQEAMVQLSPWGPTGPARRNLIAERDAALAEASRLKGELSASLAARAMSQAQSNPPPPPPPVALAPDLAALIDERDSLRQRLQSLSSVDEKLARLTDAAMEDARSLARWESVAATIVDRLCDPEAGDPQPLDRSAGPTTPTRNRRPRPEDVLAAVTQLSAAAQELQSQVAQQLSAACAGPEVPPPPQVPSRDDPRLAEAESRLQQVLQAHSEAQARHRADTARLEARLAAISDENAALRRASPAAGSHCLTGGHAASLHARVVQERRAALDRVRELEQALAGAGDGLLTEVTRRSQALEEKLASLSEELSVEQRMRERLRALFAKDAQEFQTAVRGLTGWELDLDTLQHTVGLTCPQLDGLGQRPGPAVSLQFSIRKDSVTRQRSRFVLTPSDFTGQSQSFSRALAATESVCAQDSSLFWPILLLRVLQHEVDARRAHA